MPDVRKTLFLDERDYFEVSNIDGVILVQNVYVGLSTVTFWGFRMQYGLATQRATQLKDLDDEALKLVEGIPAAIMERIAEARRQMSADH